MLSPDIIELNGSNADDVAHDDCLGYCELSVGC